MKSMVKKNISGILFFICLMISSLFLLGNQLTYAEEVVSEKYVQNADGDYLQKTEEGWFYFNKEEKPLSGIQYIYSVPEQKSNEVERGGLNTGFYMVANNGHVIQEEGMYKLKKQVVHDVKFEGYYVSASDGCFRKEPLGLKYIGKVRYNTGYKTANGIFYIDAYGSITRASAGLRYVSETTVNDVTFKSGYYYFSKDGRLYTDAQIRYIKKQTVDGKTIKTAYYYFTENGRMETDAVTYKKNEADAYFQKNGSTWYLYSKERKPLSGIQYVSVSPSKSIPVGFYMVASDGRVILEQAMYKLSRQEVKGVVFEGYHISNKKGCFEKQAAGLQYISNIKYNTGYKNLNYIVYIDAYGSITRSGAGLRYVPTTTINKVTYKAGYYHFSTNGRLYTDSLVRSVKKQIVDGKTINKGYYYFAENGRMETGKKIRNIKKCVAGSVTLEAGYYYFISDGRMKTTSGLRKMSGGKASDNVSFTTGYYYFEKNGRLNTTKTFRTLNTKIGTVTFDGTYYFGYANGRMYRKAGWVTYNGDQYYVDSTGKRLENCWQGEYYLLADGKMAKNMQLPDGSWVDYQGKKCNKDELGLSKLKTEVQKVLSKYSGSWSVYVKDLKTGEIININEKSMYPASTIKAFVMASTFNQIKKKEISYTSTIKSYLKSMITVSDNEAYNQLVKRQTNSLDFNKGFAAVNKYLQYYGYKNTECHTTLGPAYTSFRSDGKGSNKASARDCGLLLERIYKGTCVSKAYSKEMLNLLKAQERTWKIPYLLPAGVVTANKTGETSTVQHDMAIVYGAKTDYIICVFASSVTEYYGAKGIQEVSKVVYNYLNA